MCNLIISILPEIFRRVIKHRRRGTESAGKLAAAQTVQRRHLKMFEQCVLRPVGGEDPVVKFRKKDIVAHRGQFAVEFPTFEFAARHQTLARGEIQLFATP